MRIDEIDDLLNRRSGMKGLTGHNDMREVHRLIAAGDADARVGLDVYVHRLKKYIGAYAAVMGGLDALASRPASARTTPWYALRWPQGWAFSASRSIPTRNALRSDAPAVDLSRCRERRRHGDPDR